VTPRAVFVSYSQPDRAPAYEIVSRVEAEGMPCWIAPRDIAPTTDWAAGIVEAIAGARVMVLVFSASANASPQVAREVERAMDHRVVVLPFRVADVLPARSLEYFLGSPHWLDAFPPPMEPHYDRLCAVLRTLLTAPAPAGETAPSVVSGPTGVAHGAPTVALGDAAILQTLESELAAHIGPIARHLVNRAVARASGIEALIHELGGEIESDTDRRRFIDACRRALRGRG
jgi:TIR domain